MSHMIATTGYVVFAHGSSVESANQAVRAVAAEVSRRGGYSTVEAAFLEGGRPDLKEAVGSLAARGLSHVVVIPYFLTLGLHLQRDLPRLVEELKRLNPDLEIDVTPPLDAHPALVEALLDRAKESVCRRG
jgi:sirohydrochlorin ferrochelatase